MPAAVAHPQTKTNGRGSGGPTPGLKDKAKARRREGDEPVVSDANYVECH